jgi:hypothetical protein
MRIFTTMELSSGSPRPGWAEEIGAQARKSISARDEAARDEWIAGAWAAIKGDPDRSSNCCCEFRRGYDWAASQALIEEGWEAWNLAYREVTERRPIGRSSPRGSRYYGRDHELVPPAIDHLGPVDIALWKALHGMQGALLRWAIYRELGVGDPDLRLAISREFGTVNSGYVDGIPYSAYGCRRYNDNGGGEHSTFVFDSGGSKRSMTGPELVGRARSLLCLPAPGSLNLDIAPGRTAERKQRRPADAGVGDEARQLVLL